MEVISYSANVSGRIICRPSPMPDIRGKILSPKFIIFILLCIISSFASVGFEVSIFLIRLLWKTLITSRCGWQNFNIPLYHNMINSKTVFVEYRDDSQLTLRFYVASVRFWLYNVYISSIALQLKITSDNGLKLMSVYFSDFIFPL